MEQTLELLIAENLELKNTIKGFRQPLNLFSISMPAKNKIDRVLKYISVYAEITNNKLVPLDVKILSYYIIKGVSEDTLEMILEDDPRYEVEKKTDKKPFTVNHLHQINYRLRAKGYLEESPTNEKKFNLSKNMQKLANKLNVDQCKGILISL